MKVVLVVPALNEEKTIFETIASALKYCPAIVVDDFSVDATAILAEKAGATVLKNSKNFGYDKSIERGFIKAVELGYTHVITFDADGQHPAEALPKFFEKMTLGFEIVLGMRHCQPRVSEVLFSLYTQLRFKVHDPLSGFKGYNLDFYRKVGFFDSFGSFGSELALRSIKAGAKFCEIPFEVRSRKWGPSKIGSSVKANFRIFRALLTSIWTYK